jgi:hypothetical protein
MQPSRPTWTQAIIEKWSAWLSRGHDDVAHITRYDVYILLDEISRLERKPVVAKLDIYELDGDGSGDE